MFLIALVVALSCACAMALAPLSAPVDDDCALYLTGPGRSSAYDYSLNLLKGNFGYEGQHTCITYEAINQAYLDARNRILVSQPKGDWKAEDFASVGELLLDISITLARTYGLTYEEIEKGLPLIDTSRTLIREACPPVFSHVECRAGKYRRFDGLCNNLRHPTWGATMAPFQRLIGPLFSDGINAPRIAHNGHDLPLSRVVSRTMHPDDGFHDHAGTVMVIAWGQFMDHDYTLTGTPLDPINRNDPEECCKRPPHLKHPYCNEIRVPDDDYFYRLWGVKCIDFVRGFPSPRPGCRLGSRVPFNTLTGSIDGNTVYGVTEKFARKLRTGYGGLLRMNPVFKEYGLKDLLPLKLDIPDEGCTRPNKNMYCFEAGEIRVNEQLVLTVMHTLMAREHNRVAEGLAAVNPHWDDETLFQEARRINIAEIQHITYNEFLPILLGKDVMEKFGLVLEKEGYWNGYDPEVNPDVLASFAAAAYRFGHSLLPTAVERWSKAHKFIASKRLSDLIRRPYDLYRAGVLDEYVMGLMNQVAQAMDDSITQEVTNHLFKKVGARFGMDLVSFNMQRGREFGLPGYMEFRKFCGLSGADTFQELFGSMPNETVRKYESIFEHPIDVDLWSGGVSERPLPGSMLGPTFACIIATQFSYSRRGDRFWFELPNQPSSFTPEQLAEIRKSRLARIICDNTDIIDTVQLYPMVLPDHELNPRVPCRSGIIPSMDFSKWAEPVPFHGAAKQFITDAIATNNYVLRNDYVNESNTLEENKTQKCIGRSSEPNKLCAPISTSLDELIKKNVPLNLNINTTSRSTNDKIIIEKCIDSANSKTDCKQEPKKTNPNDFGINLNTTKKTNKEYLQNKTKGHSKNSISRKKRFIEKKFEPTFYKSISNLPYSASDDVSVKEDLILTKDTKGDIIKKTDFSIETLHEDPKLPKITKAKNHFAYHNFKQPHTIQKDGQHQHNIVDRKGKNNQKSTEIDSKESTESNENLYKNYKSPYSGQFEKYEESREFLKGSKTDPIDRDRESSNTKLLNLNKNNIEKSIYDRNEDLHRRILPYEDKKSIEESSESFHKKDVGKNSYEHNEDLYRRKLPHEDIKSIENSSESVYNDNINKNSYTHNEDLHRRTLPYEVNKSFESSSENINKDNIGKNSNERNKDLNLRNLPYEEKNTKHIHNDNIGKNIYDQNEDLHQRKLPYEDTQPIENSSESIHKDNMRKNNYDQNEDLYLRKLPYEHSKPIKNSSEKINEDSTEKKNYERIDDLYHRNLPYVGTKSITNRSENTNKGDIEKNSYEQIEDLNVRKLPFEDNISIEKSSENIYKDNISKNSHELNDDLYRRKLPYHEDKSIENRSEGILFDKSKTDFDVKKSTNHSNIAVAPKSLQDVDLDDFSYERIQVNNQGIVEPIKDPKEKHSSVEVIKSIVPSKQHYDKNNNHHGLSTVDDNFSADLRISKQQPFNINDEEVKPVVELNNENVNSESREESPRISQNGHLPNTQQYDSSSEEDELHIKKINGNIGIIDKDSGENPEVKQQFETIPLDYNHDHKSHKESNNIDKSQNTEVSSDESVNDGTLDALAPKINNYDEHLKTKFGDVSIQLPEIKLPDDILSYARIGAPKENEKKYHYDDDNGDEFQGIFNADKNLDYSSIYNSDKDKRYESYKKPNLEDEFDDEGGDVDLYEKFVKERFGDESLMKKKSEKLQTAENKPLNSKLLETVQKILLKTEKVKDEAEKSGDPNAGYMWTLEYGEDLK